MNRHFEPRALGPVVFRGGRVLDPASGLDQLADVVVEHGRIQEVGAEAKAPSGARIIECRGLWVTPGLIDLHVHLREPGFTHKEDIYTGARAAASGGFATIVAMPNTQPAIDNGALVSHVLARGREVGGARVLTTGAVSVGSLGHTLAPMVEMAEAGAVGFTDDGRPVSNAQLMRRALEYAALLGRPIISHAEDLVLSDGGCMHEGPTSCRLGLRGISPASEEVMVARDLILAEHTGGHVHIAHLSTRGSARLVREAKKRGVRVTCEVTPHHLTLTDERVANYDTDAKMNPPLREERDIEALIEALVDGTVDAVATDHAPHSPLEKLTTFAEAAFGVVGLETAVPILLDLVHAGLLTPSRGISLLSSGPAKVLGLPAGTLGRGGIGDVTVIDPDASFTIQRMASRSNNSPFVGQPLKGRAVLTMVGGAIVYEVAR